MKPPTSPTTRRKVCPWCQRDETRPARRKPYENLLRILLLRPHRCLRCHMRFWRFG
jgi:hypothetical protein